MTAVQTRASQQFIDAMGTMVENPAAMQQVLGYIEWMKLPSNSQMITIDELEQHGMPLHVAMNKLREKAYAFYHPA